MVISWFLKSAVDRRVIFFIVRLLDRSIEHRRERERLLWEFSQPKKKTKNQLTFEIFSERKHKGSGDEGDEGHVIDTEGILQQ